MLKLMIATASTLTLVLAAGAQDTVALPGDQDFLAQAYADADRGENFSYARAWGDGKAYDGTDVAARIQQMQPTQVAPQQVRRAAPAPQTHVTQKAPPFRQTMPTTQAPRPTVNTMRTVEQRAPIRRTRSAATAPAPQRASVDPTGEMPNAAPGQCFARMKVAAQYEMVPKQVQVSGAYQKAKITQAQFASDSEKVVMRDAHTRYEVTQPRFETRHEKVIMRPAYDRLEVVPATFKHVADTVQVSEPRLVWKRGAGLSGISRQDPLTGDTWCLVEEAGEIKTIHKRVVTQAEQVRRVPVAAQMMSVPRQVLVAPAGVREVSVPAQYREFAVQRLVAPASADAYDVPGELDTVMTKVLKAPERFEWISVLCDTNSGPDAVKSLQSALKQRGLYSGSIDGIMGPQSRKALVDFQRGAGIAHLGYLTTDTMAMLGIR
jgi:hypothetical protein